MGFRLREKEMAPWAPMLREACVMKGCVPKRLQEALLPIAPAMEEDREGNVANWVIPDALLAALADASGHEGP